MLVLNESQYKLLIRSIYAVGSNEETAGVILRNTAHSMVALWSGMYRRNKAHEVWAYHHHHPPAKLLKLRYLKSVFGTRKNYFQIFVLCNACNPLQFIIETNQILYILLVINSSKFTWQCKMTLCSFNYFFKGLSEGTHKASILSMQAKQRDDYCQRF